MKFAQASSISKRVRRVVAIAAAVVVAGTTLVAQPAPSEAAPNGNIVTLGDSFSANPDQLRNARRAFDPGVFRDYPSTAGCLQAPDNWPRQLGERTGAPIADWSCTAQTSRTALGRLEGAIQSGDLHPGTRAVVVAVGMNNFGGFGVLDGVNILEPVAVRGAYLHDMHVMVDRIRSVAPGARIVFSGQLQVTEPVSATYCSVNVVPNMPAGFPVPLLRDVENWNRGNQVDAARETGVEFVDIKDGSALHNSCAPDLDRWVAGVIDTTTPNCNMAFHPSRAGSAFMADQLAGHV